MTSPLLMSIIIFVHSMFPTLVEWLSDIETDKIKQRWVYNNEMKNNNIPHCRKILQSNRKMLEKGKLYTSLLVICASFLWSVPIDKATVDVLEHIWHLLGQFIIWHALTNAEGYVLWHYHARPMPVVANENNVTLFREVYCKMRLFAIKYSINLEEKMY